MCDSIKEGLAAGVFTSLLVHHFAHIIDTILRRRHAEETTKRVYAHACQGTLLLLLWSICDPADLNRRSVVQSGICAELSPQSSGEYEHTCVRC